MKNHTKIFLFIHCDLLHYTRGDQSSKLRKN